MRKLLTGFIDLLFPPSPEEKLLRGTESKTILVLKQSGTFEQIEYLYRYSEPVIQTAILENKFHHSRLAARLLGTALEKWTLKQTRPTIFIPIPLGKNRLQQRGHNQVETILQSSKLRLTVNNHLLRRTIETTPQSQLDKKKRLKNMQNVFTFIGKKSDFSSGSQIVLIDDVATTGATMMAARTTLAPHLPPDVILICLAIAH